MVLSVDDKADKDRGSIVVPYVAAADTTPPTVTWAWPPDGAADLALTSRFGLTFNEMIDVKSAWAGSVRLYEAGTDPATTRVEGHVSVQENVVHLRPEGPPRARRAVHARDPRRRAPRLQRQRDRGGVHRRVHHGGLMRRVCPALLVLLACGDAGGGAFYEPLRDVLGSQAVRERGIYNAKAILADLDRHRKGEADFANRPFHVAEFELLSDVLRQTRIL